MDILLLGQRGREDRNVISSVCARAAMVFLTVTGFGPRLLGHSRSLKAGAALEEVSIFITMILSISFTLPFT